MHVNETMGKRITVIDVRTVIVVAVCAVKARMMLGFVWCGRRTLVWLRPERNFLNILLDTCCGVCDDVVIRAVRRGNTETRSAANISN